MSDLLAHPLVIAARDFATAAHAGQTRKYPGPDGKVAPYISHPARVAARVAALSGATPAMVAAAWLHDTVEDCGVSLATLTERFGAEVAALVDGLTTPPISKDQSLSRAERKAHQRAHAAHQPRDVQRMKLCDRIDNLIDGRSAPLDWRQTYREESLLLIGVLTLAEDALRTEARDRADRLVGHDARFLPEFNLFLHHANPPATEADIIRLEEHLGHRLPDDYRRFLQLANGGDMMYSVDMETSPGRRESMAFGKMFGVDCAATEYFNPYEWQQHLRVTGFPQRGFLPIAEDGGGSKLFLDLREGCRLVAFVEGLPTWASGSNHQDTLVTIASSFTKYLDALAICDECASYYLDGDHIHEEDWAATTTWLDTRVKDWRIRFHDLLVKQGRA